MILDIQIAKTKRSNPDIRTLFPKSQFILQFLKQKRKLYNNFTSYFVVVFQNKFSNISIYPYFAQTSSPEVVSPQTISIQSRYSECTRNTFN